MSKYARNVDLTQSAVVDALRKAGCKVEIIGKPVDLAVRHPSWGLNLWRMLEVKRPANKRNEPRLDARQKKQAAFVAEHGVPYAVTAEDALAALGLVGFTGEGQ